MNKEFSWERLFDGNKLVLLCVFFTVSMVIQVIYAAANGTRTVMTPEVMVWQLLYLSSPILPFKIMDILLDKKIIDESKNNRFLMLPMHYAMFMGVVMFLTFLQKLLYKHPPNIFLHAFIQATILYVIFVTGAIITDLVQTAGANRSLKKIRQSQENNNNERRDIH